METSAKKLEVNLKSANDKLESFKNAWDSAEEALGKANGFIANLTKSDADLAKEAAER